MKTTEARKAIKDAYEALTGVQYFVPIKYTAIIHKVRTGVLSASDAARAIILDDDIQSSKDIVAYDSTAMMPKRVEFDFSTYRSDM